MRHDPCAGVDCKTQSGVYHSTSVCARDRDGLGHTCACEAGFLGEHCAGAFVISGAMCGIAGALLANLTEFVTPEFMHWFRSGEIMVMVLVGGMGSLFGPAFGAAAYLLFEEWVPDVMELVIEGSGQHWHFIFGPLLVILVLFAKQGLWGLIPGGRSSVDGSRDD